MERITIFLLFLTVVSCGVVKRREVDENEDFTNRNEEFNIEETTENSVGDRNEQKETNGGEDIDVEKISEIDGEQIDTDRKREADYATNTSQDIKEEEIKVSNAEKSDKEIEKTLERREEKEEGEETEDKNKPVESPKPDKEVIQQKSETNKDETKDVKKGNKDQPNTFLYLMPLMPMDQTLYPLLPYLLPLPLIFVK